MTTHDSESELAGRLGASLTPRVPRITLQHRGEQSSGLFDIGAMYAASVEQVMRRARAVRPPVFGLAQSAQASPVHAWARTPDLQHAIEIDLDAQLCEPVVRARGVGWFGVAVAWLATTAIGFTVATTVPAHSVRRAAPALAAVVQTVPVATPSVAMPAPAAPAPAAMPTTAATMQPPASAPEPVSAAAPKKIGVTPRPRTLAPARPVQTEAAPAAPQPQRATSSPESSPPPKTAPATSPPASGGSSLEDLMRKAVEADSKHH
jgi:hypothetical protein